MRWPCNASPRRAPWCSARPMCRSSLGRLAELQSGVRRDVESVEPRAYAGRFVGRQRGGDGGGLLRARTRQRHRRLDPRAGALLRRVRPQAELGTVLRPRPVAGTGRVGDRHRGDRPAGALGQGPVAGARCDRRRRPAAGRRPTSRCRRRARCACRTCASPSGRASPARRPMPRPRRISTRWPISWNAKARQVSRTARPGLRCDGSVPSVSASCSPRRSAAHASEEFLARMRAAKARRPAGRHECRCDLGARGRHDASRVAAPERAALPAPPCLGRVLPATGMCCSAR